jgi:hypothetical protein
MQVWRINRERAVDYLNTRNRIYVVDGFAGWDERYRIRVRVVCARAYHALFMRNMLIRPQPEELEHFEPDYTIYNAGSCEWFCLFFLLLFLVSEPRDIRWRRVMYAGEYLLLIACVTMQSPPTGSPLE